MIVKYIIQIHAVGSDISIYIHMYVYISGTSWVVDDDDELTSANLSASLETKHFNCHKKS